jgi:hypothetical protein
MSNSNKSIDDLNLDYDAEILKEEISEQKVNTPSVNVQKDYEQSKKFSTPDRELSPEEISPSLGTSFNPDNKQAENEAEGNPQNFLTMAQEIDTKPST